MAVRRHPDDTWAAALYEQAPRDTASGAYGPTRDHAPGNLLDVMTPPARETALQGALKSLVKKIPRHRSLELILACPGPWSARVSENALKIVVSALRKDDERRHLSRREATAIALSLHRPLLAPALAALRPVEREIPEAARFLEHLTDTLDRRHRLVVEAFR